MSASKLLRLDEHVQSRRTRFMRLLDPCYKRLERYALAMEGDRDRGLDLLGETLLHGWQHFNQLRDEQAFLSWLLTTARRIHRERARRSKLFRSAEPGYADSLIAYGPPPDLKPDLEALYRGLARLPEKQREAIVLFDLNGLSLREVQQVQGGSIAAIKVRLHRGRKHLAQLLGASYEVRSDAVVDKQVLQSASDSSIDPPSVPGHPKLVSLP